MLLLVLFVFQITVSASEESCRESVSPFSELSEAEQIERIAVLTNYCKSYSTCRGVEPSDRAIQYCVDKHKNVEDQCGGITSIELDALRFYTSSGYTYINSSIWEGESQKCEGINSVLSNALAKVPNYKGWVARGANLPISVRNEHIEGSVINYPAYTSTSSYEAFPGRDQFLIYSVTGSSIAAGSSIARESEVLFDRGTKFKIAKIINRENYGSEEKLFVMVEVAEGVSDSDLKTVEKDILNQLSKLKKDEEVNLKTLKLNSRSHWTCEQGIEIDEIKTLLGEDDTTKKIVTISGGGGNIYTGGNSSFSTKDYLQSFLQSVSQKLEILEGIDEGSAKSELVSNSKNLLLLKLKEIKEKGQEKLESIGQDDEESNGHINFFSDLGANSSYIVQVVDSLKNYAELRELFEKDKKKFEDLNTDQVKAQLFKEFVDKSSEHLAIKEEMLEESLKFATMTEEDLAKMQEEMASGDYSSGYDYKSYSKMQILASEVQLLKAKLNNESEEAIEVYENHLKHLNEYIEKVEAHQQSISGGFSGDNVQNKE